MAIITKFRKMVASLLSTVVWHDACEPASSVGSLQRSLCVPTGHDEFERPRASRSLKSLSEARNLKCAAAFIGIGHTRIIVFVAEENPLYADYGLMDVGANKQRRKTNNDNYYEGPKNSSVSAANCRFALREFFTGTPTPAKTSLRDTEHRDCPSRDQWHVIGNARLRTSVSDTTGTSYPTIAEEKPLYADYGLMDVRIHKLRW